MSKVSRNSSIRVTPTGMYSPESDKILASLNDFLRYQTLILTLYQTQGLMTSPIQYIPRILKTAETENEMNEDYIKANLETILTACSERGVPKTNKRSELALKIIEQLHSHPFYKKKYTQLIETISPLLTDVRIGMFAFHNPEI